MTRYEWIYLVIGSLFVVATFVTVFITGRILFIEKCGDPPYRSAPRRAVNRVALQSAVWGRLDEQSLSADSERRRQIEALRLKLPDRPKR
jgi:hypothetical protein